MGECTFPFRGVMQFSASSLVGVLPPPAPYPGLGATASAQGPLGPFPHTEGKGPYTPRNQAEIEHCMTLPPTFVELPSRRTDQCCSRHRGLIEIEYRADRTGINSTALFTA